MRIHAGRGVYGSRQKGLPRYFGVWFSGFRSASVSCRRRPPGCCGVWGVGESGHLESLQERDQAVKRGLDPSTSTLITPQPSTPGICKVCDRDQAVGYTFYPHHQAFHWCPTGKVSGLGFGLLSIHCIRIIKPCPNPTPTLHPQPPLWMPTYCIYHTLNPQSSIHFQVILNLHSGCSPAPLFFDGGGVSEVGFDHFMGTDIAWICRFGTKTSP